MASRSLDRSVILLLFLTLVLDFKPSYSPVKIRGESDLVLVALKAGQECHVAGNSPGVSRRSRMGSILPPCLKGKVFLSFSEFDTNCFLSNSTVGRHFRKSGPSEGSLRCVLERLPEKSKSNPM